MTTHLLKRILILTANPRQTNRLRLDEEVREIDDALRRARHRDQLELVQRWAVTPREMQRAILEVSPQIVHFSGHGVGDQGLALEDETGQVKFVNATALAGLFQLFADQVECVLLNACYSEVQAEAIRKHIKYVIGMNQPIGDRAAIEFAVGFYDALGMGRDYDFAYDFGCSGIRMIGVNQANIPVLIKKKSQDNILNNTTVTLCVHGWLKQEYENSSTLELDWTQYFDIDAKPRRIADQETWDNVLLPSLVKAREQLSQGRASLTVDVRGKFPLTTAVAIGAVFPDTRGYTLQIKQRTLGQDYLWRSDASLSDAKFKIVKEDGKTGEHLLFALGITGDALRDLERLRQNSPVPFSSFVYAEPESGTGEGAISSDADTIALAIHAKELIRYYRQKYDANNTHLVLYAPVGFCLFLGQRLRVVGDVVTYERVADNNYQPSVELHTG
ncbi:MAG: SAVED domain-containing protein [Fischerella sp. CENA71]|nr:SAVED domain-containing protein [Fischerella sp. CENA71]